MQELENIKEQIRQLTKNYELMSARLRKLEGEKPGLSRAASPSDGPEPVCPKDDWEAVKQRWPLFHMGRLSKEAYARHYKTLGIEPAKETLLRFYAKLPQGRVLQWFEVSKYLEVKNDIAACYLWWLKTAGMIRNSKSQANHYEIVCNADKLYT